MEDEPKESLMKKLNFTDPFYMEQYCKIHHICTRCAISLIDKGCGIWVCSCCGNRQIDATPQEPVK